MCASVPMRVSACGEQRGPMCWHSSLLCSCPVCVCVCERVSELLKTVTFNAFDKELVQTGHVGISRVNISIQHPQSPAARGRKCTQEG